MILCIISGACRQPAHANSRVAPNQPPLELSDEEKKKKQEKAQELRRQRLIQSFEVNNVLMVSEVSCRRRHDARTTFRDEQGRYNFVVSKLFHLFCFVTFSYLLY